MSAKRRLDEVDRGFLFVGTAGSLVLVSLGATNAGYCEFEMRGAVDYP